MVTGVQTCALPIWVVDAGPLGNGSIDNDMARAEESLKMFKNGGRVREADMQATVGEMREVITAWHQIADWARKGMETRLELSAAGTAMVLLP
jgi:hypothetical protein